MPLVGNKGGITLLLINVLVPDPCEFSHKLNCVVLFHSLRHEKFNAKLNKILWFPHPVTYNNIKLSTVYFLLTFGDYENNAYRSPSIPVKADMDAY